MFAVFFIIRPGTPQAHLHAVAVLWFMSDIYQTSLPTPFSSVLVSVSVFMALSTVFHSINSPDSCFLNLFFQSYLCLIGPFICVSLYESLLQPWCNPLWLTGFHLAFMVAGVLRLALSGVMLEFPVLSVSSACHTVMVPCQCQNCLNGLSTLVT